MNTTELPLLFFAGTLLHGVIAAVCSDGDAAKIFCIFELREYRCFDEHGPLADSRRPAGAREFPRQSASGCRPFRLLRVQRPELPPEDLPHGALGQGVQERDLPRHLVEGQPFLAVFDDLLFRQGFPGP